jgi:tetratricopeptide (TPR) repeat protein
MNNERLKNVTLGLVVVVGMASAALLVRWTDTLRPPVDPNAIDESLYLNDKTVRRMSLGFNGLAADWYWMRSLQYAGKKLFDSTGDISLDDLSGLNMKLLAPLLDTATTLDPEFIQPYEYAAVVLPAIDVQQAIRLTQKGINANPNVWQLYHHLGYIYWRQGQYEIAAETYGRGAQIPGAPAWMEAMKAKLISEGGSRSTAREIYTRMYEQAGEEHVKEMARKQLMRLESLDQQDGLSYSQRTRHATVNVLIRGANWLRSFARCASRWTNRELHLIPPARRMCCKPAPAKSNWIRIRLKFL